MDLQYEHCVRFGGVSCKPGTVPSVNTVGYKCDRKFSLKFISLFFLKHAVFATVKKKLARCIWQVCRSENVNEIARGRKLISSAAAVLSAIMSSFR